MSNNKIRELYEVFRVQEKVGLFLEDHMERLFSGAEKAGIKLNFDSATIENYLKKFLLKENVDCGNIRLSVYFDSDTGEVQSHKASVIPHSYPTQEQYQNGVSCSLLFSERDNPGTKIANTTLRNNANKLIKDHNVFEVLLVNHQKEITEGSRSNVFFILNNQLHTAPDEWVLPGIARKKILKTARDLQIQVHYSALPYDKIKEVEAAFITGTSPRVLPIKNIEGFNLKADHPIIQQLTKGFSKLIIDYINSHLH